MAKKVFGETMPAVPGDAGTPQKSQVSYFSLTSLRPHHKAEGEASHRLSVLKWRCQWSGARGAQA